MNSSIRCTMLVFSTALCLYKVQAQVTELDPVTITASIQPVSSSVTGRNIVVLKGEQIANLPVNSIDELLRYLPGAEVQMRGPMGSQSDIILRGGTFQQVLVILDGIRINDPNTGHFSSYIPIAPAEIERIEILKGAASALYGSEAVGGVIQVITKAFAAKQKDDLHKLSAQVAVGDFGLLNAQAGGFYQKNKTAISGGFISNNASGQPKRGIYGFFHNQTLSASVRQGIGKKINVFFRGAYDNRDFAAQNFYTTFLSDTAREKVSTWLSQARIAYVNGSHEITLDAAYKAVEDHYRYNSLATTNLNKSRLAQSLALYKWHSAFTSFTGGLQWLNKQIHSNDRGNHRLNQVAGFATLSQQLFKRFTVNPAVRLDWNERTKWQLIPQLNLSYKNGKWQVRASGGKTIRDADFTERFNNYNKKLVTGGSIGNPDLSPEKSFSYETGADYYAGRSFKISASLFNQHFSKLIDYVPTPYAQMPRKVNLLPTGNYALASNISKLRNTGLEADIQYSRLFNKRRVWTSMGITWIDTHNSQPATPSFYISSHARFLTNFNVQYEQKWLLVSVNGLYKHRNAKTANAINATISKDYFVLNAMMKINVYQQKAGFFAQADNVFDKHYSDLLGATMPGRWFMAGIKVSL